MEWRRRMARWRLAVTSSQCVKYIVPQVIIASFDWPAAVLFDYFVDLGHEADGFG